MFAEALDIASKNIGDEIRCRVNPWKRSQSIVEKSIDTKFIYPLTRTANREKKFKWVYKVVSDKKVFIASKKFNNNPKNVSAFKKMKIGVISGSPYEKELIKLKVPNIDSTKGAATNAKKLIKGRVDLWYVPYNTAAQTFKKLGIDPS